MAARIPCLGFPSLTAACVALRADGLSNKEIAEKVDRTPEQVSCLLAGLRQKHGRTIHIRLSGHACEVLGRHAERRGVQMRTLVEKLVETAVEASLVDGVLDDADEWGEA